MAQIDDNVLNKLLAAVGNEGPNADLAKVMMSGNAYTGQRVGSQFNNPMTFDLGSAIGAAYKGVEPLRKMNAQVSIGRNKALGQIQSAQAAADAQKELARQQTAQQQLKTSALAALLGQFMQGGGMRNPSANLQSFTTDYGAGIGR